MNISKKKKQEFDNIFKSIGSNNFFIDINLFRNLFESDFYEHFLLYVDEKIKESLKLSNEIILHSNINLISVKDTYYYSQILEFSKLLHKYTKNIIKIIIYGSSSLFCNFVKLINLTLGINIYDKIVFSPTNSNINLINHES